MKNNDIHSSEADESLFETQIDMPDTSVLKSRILQLTETMPQQVVHKKLAGKTDSRHKDSFSSKLFELKVVAPFAVAASVILMAVLLLPNGVPNAPQQMVASVDVTSSQVPFTVDDDLDFQEAMVFFDEQIFAQL